MTEEKFSILFGKNLARYMQQHNVSQNELARRLGVSPTSVNNWCQGLKTPRMDKVDKICRLFGIRRVDLIAESAPDPDRKAISNFDDSLSSNEQALLECYRSLNDSGKKAMEDYAQLLSSSEQYTKKKGNTQVG